MRLCAEEAKPKAPMPGRCRHSHWALGGSYYDSNLRPSSHSPHPLQRPSSTCTPRGLLLRLWASRLVEGPGTGDWRCCEPEGLGQSKMGQAGVPCSPVAPGPEELWAVGRVCHLRPPSGRALWHWVEAATVKFYFDAQSVPLGSPMSGGHCQTQIKTAFWEGSPSKEVDL